MMYTIKKTDKPITQINDAAWETAEVAELEQINWPQVCDYNPGMQARILYSTCGLHVKLTTQEQPLRACETEQNSLVCNDSCMEFFIRPNENDARYFNMEFNPLGTMYLGLRTDRYNFTFPTQTRADLGVVSEVRADAWSLMFTLPFAVIDQYLGGHTKTMYGNLYKCGNADVHRHYVTYYPIKTDAPEYHSPEFFGAFVLE